MNLWDAYKMFRKFGNPKLIALSKAILLRGGERVYINHIDRRKNA